MDLLCCFLMQHNESCVAPRLVLAGAPSPPSLLRQSFCSDRLIYCVCALFKYSTQLYLSLHLLLKVQNKCCIDIYIAHMNTKHIKTVESF